MAEALRILLTGSTGQVGNELLRTLAPLGDLIAPSRDEMDLADPISVRDFIEAARPQWIVNAAGYTAVDKAESNPELADIVNRYSVGVIGREAAAIGAAVLHFSTDYVFSGEGDLPYRESDPTGPLSVYGASKLAGEQALAVSGAAHIIIRTSWVFGAAGNNFLRTILRLARERDQLCIVDDQHGAPTWSRDLAELTARILLRGGTIPSGVYHASGTGETTWFGFAKRALELLKNDQPDLPLANLLAIPTSAYPTPARRPQNSRLDCTKLNQTFAWRMMDWQESLAAVLAEIAVHEGGPA